MAKTTKAPIEKKAYKRTKFLDFKDYKWVLNNLSDQEFAALDALDFDAERFMESVELLIDKHGLELKMGWDAYSECFMVSLQGSWLGYPNTGYCVAARSESVLDALKILWFKYEVVAGGDLASVYHEPQKQKKRG